MRMKMLFRIAVIVIPILTIIGITGCSEKNNMTGADPQTLAKHGFLGQFNQYNLVADFAAPGARLDPFLKNAWGVAVTPTGRFWISATETGVSTIYDSAGNEVLSPVTIPTVGNVPGGSPTGAVFNFTTVFKLPDANISRFIFAGEDGIISAWGPSSGATAVVTSDQSAQESVYKGLEIGESGGNFYLYATNFKQSRVDVFDQNYNLVTGFPFTDPNIPSDYGPFNIKNINGMLYVTYAKHLAPDNEDDEAGPGNGYVDVYTTAGMLVNRFATRGTLNSPWGITEGFSGKISGEILIGNFGDGRINVFSQSGEFVGQLLDRREKPIEIEGLWALFTSNTITAVENRIYFTAGPNDEENGLFGYLLHRKDE